MKDILFVINPHAGQTTVEEFERALHGELSKLPADGNAIRVEQFVPESPERMRDTLRQKFAQKPVDVIAVVGGDGSILEILPILVEFPSIRLALIPCGTGNLLAANLNIPKDFAASLDTVFHGAARRIDLASVNGTYFTLIVGVGVVADMMENTARHYKKRFGVWAYVIHGIKALFQAERSRFTVTTENLRFTAKGVTVLVSNAARLLGPCIPLTPDAEPDDGLLDVCIIRSRSNRDYLPIVLEILLHRATSHRMPRQVIRFRTRRVRIESSRLLKVQADGNVLGTTPVDIEIIRSGLQIMVPRY